MRRKITAIGGVVAAFVLAGSTLAAGNITVKALGAFGVGNQVGYANGHVFDMQAAPGSLVLTVLVRVPPGGAFPWHYHTAGLSVTVTDGTLTVQDAGTCDTQAFNAGSTLAVLYVTYMGIPAGSPPDVFEPASYDPC
jgi:hypothetical protein